MALAFDYSGLRDPLLVIRKFFVRIIARPALLATVAASVAIALFLPNIAKGEALSQDDQVDWDHVRDELRKSHDPVPYAGAGSPDAKGAKKSRRRMKKKEANAECACKPSESPAPKKPVRLNGYVGGALSGNVLSFSASNMHFLMRAGVEVMVGHIYLAGEFIGGVGGELLTSGRFIGSVGGQIKGGVALNNDYTILYFSAHAEYFDVPLDRARDVLLGVGGGIGQRVTSKIRLFVEYKIGFPLRQFGAHDFFGWSDSSMFSLVGGVDFVF